MGPQQETRELSGKLKELYGQVHRHLGAVDTELTTAKAEKRKAIMDQLRSDLLAAQSEIEIALNEVNSDNGPQARSRAEDLIVRVNALLARAKEINSSAVN